MIALFIFSFVVAIWAYVCGMAFISLVFINRSNMSRHMFASVFCLYCLMFSLLSLEVLEIKLSGAKEFLVILAVSGSVSNCVITPALSLQSLFRDVGLGKALSVVATAFTTGALLYASRSLLEVSWATVFSYNLVAGTICNGLLSGFAAINTPYNFLFPVISKGRIQRANKVLDALSKRQKIIIDAWCAKRRKINSDALNSSSQKGTFSISRIFESLKGNTGEMECAGMENVSLAIFLEIDELSSFSHKNIESNILKMINLLIGILISIFGIGKIASTFLNFVSGGSAVIGAKSDTDGTKTASASQAAIITNGIMMMMSLRGFLLAAFRLSTKVTNSLATHTATLFFTSAFGVFAMSQFALSVRFLSKEHQHIIFNTCGVFDSEAYTPWNNLSFIVAATAAFSLKFIWASTAATD